MPLYYDLNYAFTTSSSAGTEVSQVWAKTAANQETVNIVGLYLASRFGTAGGGQARIKSNTGATASGGTSQTPAARNLRYGVASQSLWTNAGATITAGATLTVRMTVGFAQTGGMGGWIPITPQDGIQMMPNATNPVDLEFTALASSASVTADMTVEFTEGV
jgi:hypothetical protein